MPATGYHFVDWSPGGSTANPRTDANVMANVSVSANCAIDTFTLDYIAGANGTLSGDASQVVDYDASGTAVSAVPDLGYHFVDWSPGGSTQNPRTDTNVQADVSVTANFAIDTFTLDYAAGAYASLSGDAARPSTTAPTAPPSAPCRPPATTSSTGAPAARRPTRGPTPT